MAEKIERRCLEIERSLNLNGFISNLSWLNCDVTSSVDINGKIGNYALLSQGLRFGLRELGYIDSLTREFKKFESQKDKRGLPTEVTVFESIDSNKEGRKTRMYVPISQLKYLIVLDDEDLIELANHKLNDEDDEAINSYIEDKIKEIIG